MTCHLYSGAGVCLIADYCYPLFSFPPSILDDCRGDEPTEHGDVFYWRCCSKNTTEHKLFQKLVQCTSFEIPRRYILRCT